MSLDTYNVTTELQALIIKLDLILFAAFISLVILRCFRQHLMPKQEDGETLPTQVEGEAAEREQEKQQALVVAEGGEAEREQVQQQALVVAEGVTSQKQ
jgi:hypothetical protein